MSASGKNQPCNVLLGFSLKQDSLLIKSVCVVFRMKQLHFEEVAIIFCPPLVSTRTLWILKAEKPLV